MTNSIHANQERVTGLGDFDIHETRSLEGHGKYIVKRADIRHTDSGIHDSIEERLRLYTKDDLRTMLKSVDLVPREVFGDYQGNEFVDGVSERVIIVSDRP